MVLGACRLIQNGDHQMRGGSDFAIDWVARRSFSFPELLMRMNVTKVPHLLRKKALLSRWTFWELPAAFGRIRGGSMFSQARMSLGLIPLDRVRLL
jgi:hypothetical protein